MAATSADPLVPVVFAPDQGSAQRYADALASAGIEAHIRIEDGAHLAPMGSAYGALTSSEPFVYPVLVSRLQRRAASRVLRGMTPASTSTINARTVATASAVVLGSMLLVVLAAWVRGDL